MTTKNESEKALEAREKELDAREKDLAKREKAQPAEVEPEDLTPSPTQAENDAAKLGLGNRSAAYNTRDAKAE